MSAKMPDPNPAAASNPGTAGALPARDSGEGTLAPPNESSENTVPISSAQFAALEFPSLPGYDLQEELGRGAMGVVFKALQVDLKRVVALKMILSGSQAGTTEVQRFRLEAEAAAHLDHPAIVPIYEVGEHEGRHFFSMKYIEGGTLKSRLDEFAVGAGDDSSTDLADRQVKIACLLAKVAEAVHCAHERGILHRDLKPGNILLDARGEPHVADFGLAKRVEEECTLTQTGVILGSPSYMSPEQAAGKRNLTPAADIYSLGAILYELLTGRPPFKADSVMETLIQVMDREPPSPRSVNPCVSRDLETICLKAMAKNPEKRYRSALEVAEELSRFAAGQPIKARPPGWVERSWQRCRQNPVVAGLSGILLVLLLAFTGLLFYRMNPSNDGSLDRVKTAGKLVIAVATKYPPMEFIKDNRLTGFDVELAEQLALRLGVKPQFLHADWDWPKVPVELNLGNCDMVISAWTITSQRKQDAAFVEYLRMGQVFACIKGVTVRSEQDLADKVVVVGRDTVQYKYLRNLADKGLAIKSTLVLSEAEDPFPYLKQRKAEVTIVDEPVGRYHARLDPEIVVTGSIGHAMDPDPVGMVFRQKDIQLQEAVAKTLHAMKEDGSFGQILEKWFGK